MHLSSFICIFFKKKKANVNFCHPAPICRHPGAGWDPLRRRHFSCHPAARAPRDVSRGWMQTPGPRLINSSRSDTNRCCLCCRTGHQFTWIPRSSRGMTSKENAGHRGQPAHHKNIRFCGGTTRRGMTNKKNAGAPRVTGWYSANPVARISCPQTDQSVFTRLAILKCTRTIRLCPREPQPRRTFINKALWCLVVIYPALTALICPPIILRTSGRHTVRRAYCGGIWKFCRTHI